MHGRISIKELAQRRDEILSRISKNAECWEIYSGPEDHGQVGFILGGVDLLSSVIGLVDEEYGWPVSVDADAAVRRNEGVDRRYNRVCFEYAELCVDADVQLARSELYYPARRHNANHANHSAHEVDVDACAFRRRTSPMRGRECSG